jgi:hypothetical protein
MDSERHRMRKRPTPDVLADPAQRREPGGEAGDVSDEGDHLSSSRQPMPTSTTPLTEINGSRSASPLTKPSAGSRPARVSVALGSAPACPATTLEDSPCRKHQIYAASSMLTIISCGPEPT